MSQPSPDNPTVFSKDNTFVNVHGDLHQSNHYHEDLSGRKEANLSQLKDQLQRLSSIFRNNPQTCTDGTRVRIRQEISRWITPTSSQTPQEAGHANWPDESQDRRILWINGAAGTGKTTLACTLVKDCKAKGIHCACFFAYRGDNARSDPKRIIPVIASELASHHRAFGDFFHERLEKCAAANEILEWEIAYQMEQLIVGPLQACARRRNPLRPGVVLIDALDECLRDDETQTEEVTIQIITAIAKNIRHVSPLRFIVTCRPEQRFLDLFDHYERESILVKLVLHDDRWRTKSDIRVFLVGSLAALSLSKRAPASGWPSDDDIAELVNYSQNLFLIAETCLRFISDPGKKPVRALSELLKDIRSQNTLSLTSFAPKTPRQSPNYSSINHLYNVVLTRTPLSLLDADGRESFCKVLGTIVLSRIPLCALSIAKLIGLPGADGYQVYEELRVLHSVILIPENEKEDIRLLHQSFADFIVDDTRCHSNFLLNARAHHMFLAQRCIDIWQEELKDECHPDWDPTKATRAIQDKSHIRYAAQFWGRHLCAGFPTVDHEIFDQILELFSSEHLKYWIEFSARRGILRSTLSNIRSVLHFLEKHDADKNANPDLHEQLQMTEQWIRRYYTILEEVPFQVYHLPYTPPLVAAIEGSGDAISWVKDLALKKDTVSSKICRVEMNSQADKCATFRRGEDDYILAGSASGDLEVWDMLSGVMVHAMGPETWTTAIAVSHDGEFAVVGDENGTTKLWDLRAKIVCGEAKIHEECICAIDVYGIGQKEDLTIISGDVTGEAIVWKFSNSGTRGFRIISEPKVAYDGSVANAAFSANGCLVLAVWKDEETLFVWDVKSRREMKLDNVPAGVISAAFSPITGDLPTLACGTSNGLTHLWKGGVYEAEWSGRGEEIEEGRILAISFSPDGKRIASLLDVDNRESRVTISGVDDNFRRCIVCPGSGVDSLAFSRDGIHLVTTTSRFVTMHVWRVPTLDGPETINVQPSPVTCVEISPRADMVVAGSKDGTFSLWSLGSATAQRLPDFEGCLPGLSVTCATFSADGKTLAIGLESIEPSASTQGNAVYVIDIPSPSAVQNKLRILEVPAPVYIIAFSPINGQILAYTGTQLSVEVRDIRQDLVVSKLEGIHRQAERLAAFAFSPDGTKIATANEDSKIIVWDIADGVGLWEYKFSRNSPDTVVFTSDGKGIVAMTQSRAIGLFDVHGDLITLVGSGAVASQKMGSRPPGIFSELVETLWEYETQKLLGPGVPQQEFSSYNCKVLTSWLANLGRNRYVEQNEPMMIIQDGWLWCLVRRRRIMPIPESLHVDTTSSFAQRRNYVTFGSEGGQFHILDITMLLKQLDIHVKKH